MGRAEYPTFDSRPCETPPVFSWPKLIINMVLLPALVVACLVGLVVGLQWLTGSETPIPELVERIARGGRSRWPAAMELAVRLGRPETQHWRRNSALAGRLARLLEEELQREPAGVQDARLSVYLCRALGQFETAEPLPALLRAVERGLPHAGQQSPPDAKAVQQARAARPAVGPSVRASEAICSAALEAVAQLLARLGPEHFADDARLAEVLLGASHSPSAEIRLRAAFVLGVAGTQRAEARLVEMLGDAVPEVRFNAATGLARGGNMAAVDVLAEMLRFESPAAPARQSLVRRSALRALVQLAERGPAECREKLAALLPRIRELAGSSSRPELRREAAAFCARLGQAVEPGPASLQTAR